MIESGKTMNRYEQERQERIRQNMERMKALDLQNLGAAVAPPPPRPNPASTKRTIGVKRRISEHLPRRRSSRLQGVEADGKQIFSEKRNGEVLVQSGSGISYPDKPVAEPLDTFSKEDLPCRSTYTHESTDASFLSTLRSSPSKSTTITTSKYSDNMLDKIKSLTLQDDDVKKVTSKSITHLGFCPRSDILIIAAADKYCTLGLWNVDFSNGAQSNDSDNECDGTYMFPSVHRQYVSGLKWADPRSLFTCSYDGSVRHLDVQSEKFLLAWGDEDKDYSAFEVSSDCTTAILGDKYGDVDIIDLRRKQRISTIELHNKKINTLHLDGSLLVTGSTDTRVSLFDIRKLGSGKTGKPLATSQHNNSCQSAYFAPDGSQQVLTTSLDNTVRVWDAKNNLAESISIKHDNNTGQWLSPFRAVWTPCGAGAVIGNMHRYVDVINVKSGKMAVQLQGEGMTAIPTRNAVHPNLPVVCGATGSGRCHVYR